MSEENPSRVTWDGRINFGMVLSAVQFFIACGMGFYAFGHIEAQMTGLTDQIGVIRTDLRSSLDALQHQIDTGNSRTDFLFQRRQGP